MRATKAQLLVLAIALTVTALSLPSAAGTRPKQARQETGERADRAPAATSSALSSSHIVFVSNRDGDDEVYAINADGSGLAHLTNNRRDDNLVSVSRDGRRLAVACGESSLCIMRSDGRALRRLTGRDPWAARAWSPDGSTLAYEGKTGLSLVSTAARMRRLTQGARDEFIDWSPDSRFVLFLRRRTDEAGDLHVIRATGAAVKEIASRVSWGGWSPTGSTIAYVVPQDRGDEELVLYDVRSGQARTIYSHEEIDFKGWSPDGTRLAILVEDASSELSVEVFDVSELRVVARAPIRYGSPLWSPDSRAIAVGEDYGSFGAISVLTVATGTLRRLRPGLANAWSPDSRWIAYFARGVSIVQVDSSRSRLVFPGRGSTSISGWFPGRVPRALPRARRLPSIETATATAFRARGPIWQLSGSGSRVAISVGESALDCPHVVVWTTKARAIARASAPNPCDGLWPRQEDLDLLMRGRRVYWATPWECGNEECGRYLYFGLLRGPRRLTVKYRPQTYYHDDGDEAPALPWGGGERTPTRARPVRVNGMTMFVTGRRIHVAGRVFTPPGAGAVLARLTRSGLFYAYNTKGSFPGRVIFVPFARLR